MALIKAGWPNKPISTKFKASQQGHHTGKGGGEQAQEYREVQQEQF